MPLTLDRLDNDALHLIFQWILTISYVKHGPAYRGDARFNFSCVNKHFRSIAIPIIFRRIHCHDDNSGTLVKKLAMLDANAELKTTVR